MRFVHRLSALATAASLACVAHAARAECPGSTLLYGTPDPSIAIAKVAARVDTTFSIQSCDRVHGRYDVPAGLLIASIDFACNSTQPGGAPSGLEAIVQDDFDLVGLAPGTPVSLSLAMHLKGEAHSFGEPGGPGGGQLRATMLEGASNSTSFLRATTALEPSIFVSEALTLPIAAISGTPIHVRIAIRAEAFEGRGDLEGLMEFSGLPPGVHLQSCRGYSSDAPVPARATSWGRLKASYR